MRPTTALPLIAGAAVFVGVAVLTVGPDFEDVAVAVFVVFDVFLVVVFGLDESVCVVAVVEVVVVLLPETGLPGGAGGFAPSADGTNAAATSTRPPKHIIGLRINCTTAPP